MTTSQIIPKHRKTKKWSQKYQDTKQKSIRFLNRTYEQLIIAMMKLKERYKKVVLERKLINGWYTGQFIVS